MRFLLLAAAALIALTPGVASAHRGHEHGVAGQPAAQPLALPAEQSPGWTSPCPGGAGGKCCRETQSACFGGTPPGIAGAGFTVDIPRAQAETPRPLRAAPPSKLAQSPSLARAPPVLS